MSHIAAKCRQYATWIRKCNAYDPSEPEALEAFDYEVEAQTFDDAADEIERLRAALEDTTYPLGEIEGLMTEIERLRAAVNLTEEPI